MRSVFSIANCLTLVRLVSSPINVWCILERKFFYCVLLFVLAVVSDVFDGIFARRQASASRLGGILDHSADCLFVSSALFALVALGQVPIILPTLIVIAFVQYLFDSRVFQRHKLVPSRLGRWNGISYFVLVGVMVAENAFGFSWLSEYWIRPTLSWVLIVSTVISIVERLWLLHVRKTNVDNL